MNHNNIEILSKNIPFASCNKAGPFSSRQAENPDGETTKTMHKKFLGWRRGRRLRFSVLNCSQKWQLVVGNTYLPIHICKYFSFCTITKFNNISFKVFRQLCLPKLKSESWKHCRGRPPSRSLCATRFSREFSTCLRACNFYEYSILLSILFSPAWRYFSLKRVLKRRL